MKKGDKIVMGIVLALLVLIGSSYLLMRYSSENVELVIEQHGVELRRIALDETVNMEFRLEDEDHYNVVTIVNGVVSMTEANCKNQICVNTRPIKYAGEQIVCLPHELVLRIQGQNVVRDTVVN